MEGQRWKAEFVLMAVVWLIVGLCVLMAGCTAVAVAGTKFVQEVRAARTAEREDQYRERVFQMFEKVISEWGQDDGR